MLFALPSGEAFRDVKVLPRSEIFFTQMENCYALELSDIAPAQVQLELPELPHGTLFVSSKKEEFMASDGERGTLISLWFTFSESEETRIPPLLVRINGEAHYIEFEPVFVHENPNLIAPVLEISFEQPNRLTTQGGKRTIAVKQGEKITFTVALRYGTQVLDFSWQIPKDSIFTERERSEFANGAQQITQFTTERKNLARFDWKILKEGTYPLPEITVETIAFNGTKRRLALPQSVQIAVTKQAHEISAPKPQNSALAAAFAPPPEAPPAERPQPLTREECESLAKQEKRGFLQRLFGEKYAIFVGAAVAAVPEEKASGQFFAGGQKVRVTESAGEWSFIECEEFSGWTKKENLCEIK